MNFTRCPICADCFGNMQDVAATHCGHTFHYVCLDTWMKQSMTCPQCRKRILTRQVIPKLYFEMGVRDDSDVGEILNRIDDLNLKLLEKENLCAAFMNERRSLKSSNEELQAEKNSLQELLEFKCSAFDVVQKESYKLELKLEKLMNLKTELEQAQDQLEEMKMVNSVLNVTDEEAEEILKQYGTKDNSVTCRSLAQMCACLAKGLSNSKKHKHQLVLENLTCKRQVDKLQAGVKLNDLKIKEMKSIMDKMAKDVVFKDYYGDCLTPKGNPTPSMNNIEHSYFPDLWNTTEIVSPVRTDTDAALHNISLNIQTPKLVQTFPRRPMMKVQQMKFVGTKPKTSTPTTQLSNPSDVKTMRSPVLQVKCTGAIPKSGRVGATRLPTRKILKPVATGVGYDGLGGSSKVDEYPKPKIPKMGTVKKITKPVSVQKYGIHQALKKNAK